MNIYKAITLLIINVFVIVSILLLTKSIIKRPSKTSYAKTSEMNRFWKIQSIDVMKYSRDTAREKLTVPAFDKDIEMMVSNIAKTGATHIAIGTPYDDEFIPFLERWVNSARKHNLNVWFRGNFSGWEKWFGYDSISRKDHIEKTYRFITQNPNLFKDGDIFTACPECENGGPGDPRQEQSDEKTREYREFLFSLDDISKQGFKRINKDVATNYYSMNGDVARLIMDEATSERLGNVIVVDHYVLTPERLNNDITNYATTSKTDVVLGEFGAPIPDIHGDMNEQEQAKWIEDSLDLLSRNKSLIGLNYWVNVGGSTQLWDYDKKRLAVDVLTSYFKPKQANINAINELKEPIKNFTVLNETDTLYSQKDGNMDLIFVKDAPLVTISSSGYMGKTVRVNEGINQIMLIKEPGDFWFDLKLFIKKIFPSIY